MASGSDGSKFNIQTYDLLNHTKFKTLTKGWSVVQVSGLTIHALPPHGMRDLAIEMHYCWIPTGEDVPTTSGEFEDFPLHGRLHLFPQLAGQIPQAVTFPCPFGQDGLVSNVKPKPVAGGFPKLVTCIQVFKKDGTHENSKDAACIFYEFNLQLGL